MAGRSQATEAAGMGQKLRPVAVSVLSGIVFCVILLLIMSLIITTQNIPQSFIEPMSILAVSAGAFVAGYFCAKALKTNGLINGAACGAVLCVVVLIGGFFISSSGFGIPALFRIAFIMLSSMIGGVIGVNIRKRNR